MNLRVIPTGVHGVLDYLASGINLAFPRLLGLHDAPWAVLVLRIDGVAGASYSLLTDYEFGAFKVLFMPVHLTFDATKGVFAMAVWIRQERHPLLANTCADGHRGRAGRDNEQD